MRKRTYYLILTSLFAALTCVGAFVKIPVGPVPVTLQLLFVVLGGLVLGPGYGTLAQVIYIALGLVGVPVFTGGGGFGYVMQPSFGYLLGFIPAAFIAGVGGRKIRGSGSMELVQLFLWSFAGILCCYLVGVPYMFLMLTKVAGTPMSLGKLLISGFLVFVPGDLFKSLASAWLGMRLRPVAERMSQD